MRYTIDLDLDEAGWWVASARGIPGCRTQGRSIRQASRRVRQALSVCTGIDEISAEELSLRIHLPEEAQTVIARYESASKGLERKRQAVREAGDIAIETLSGDLNLSTRDVADLLKLSHQRVHQLSKGRG